MNAAILLMLTAVTADDAAFRPARPAAAIETAVLRCFEIHNRDGPVTGATEIMVSVDAEGRATAVTTPPDIGERLAMAAQCAGATLPYTPALKDGIAVEDRLVLEVRFPSLPQVRGELRRVVDYCHAPWSESEIWLGTRDGDMDARVGAVDPKALEGSVNMLARVGTDGKIKEHHLPAGVLPWMTESVQCVADRLEFYPALLRTTLVESWVVVPLQFNLSEVPHLDAEIIPPRPRSDEATILAAYRACYPAGQVAAITIQYRITVAKTGRVRKAELLESSGNRSLDEAGICILKNLAFTAARRNGRAVESTLNWPILVRPPD